jgi:hypothetical protein
MPCRLPTPKAMTLLTALKTRVLSESVVCTDGWASYHILDVSGFKHHRINHPVRFVGGAATTSMASITSGTNAPVYCVAATESAQAFF